MEIILFVPLSVCRHLHEEGIIGWTAVAVVDFYLKYQNIELLDLFTGLQGVLNQGCALSHSSISVPLHYLTSF